MNARCASVMAGAASVRFAIQTFAASRSSPRRSSDSGCFRARERSASIETQELQAAEYFRDFVLRHRLVHYRQQPLRLFKRALDFPITALRLHRLGRDHKYDRVGLRNEPAEPILP